MTLYKVYYHPDFLSIEEEFRLHIISGLDFAASFDPCRMNRTTATLHPMYARSAGGRFTV